ncbi:MAG: DMT family transporter [Granulosicoccus sp.]
MRAVSLVGLSVLFVALWSSGWVLSRFAVEEVSAIALLTMRYVIVFCVLLIVVTVAGYWRKVSMTELACHLSVGVLSHAIYLLSGVGAFELGVSASLVAFVTALQPMITAYLSAPITGEVISSRQWQGLIIGFLAVLLLVSESYRQGIATIALSLPFISVLALSIGALISRRLDVQNQRKKCTPIPIPFVLLIHSAGALFVLVPLSASQGQLLVEVSKHQWVMLLWLALAVSLGAYAVMLILLRHLSAMRVSSLAYFVPPATLIQAHLLFNDVISVSNMVSLVLASIAVYFVMIPKAKQSRLRRWADRSKGFTLTPANSGLISAVTAGRDPDIKL